MNYKNMLVTERATGKQFPCVRHSAGWAQIKDAEAPHGVRFLRDHGTVEDPEPEIIVEKPQNYEI